MLRSKKIQYKGYFAVLLALTMLVMTACSSTKIQKPPKWFDQQSEPETYFYGFGEGVSSDSNIAARQARLNAQGQLAESFAIYVESEARQAGQVDLGEQMTSGTFLDALQARVQETVQSVEMDKVERVRQKDGSTRVFVRMRMPRNQGARTGRQILDEFDARMRETRGY